jgi:membrane protease YdiL (CAAX protease family)
MKLTKRQRTFLYLLPILLILSTASVFVFSAKWLGKETGYVLGFVFYWVIWCLMVPLLMLKREGARKLFREENKLFQKQNWLAAVLLIMIIVITVIMYPPAGLLASKLKLILIAIPIAIINSVCEEMLWRGLYVKAFRGNILLGVIYPSIGFAMWHISPQLIVPASTGILPFVLSTFFLGISYAWISYRTSSIKWNAISHSLGGILDLGGAIAPSILILLFS